MPAKQPSSTSAAQQQARKFKVIVRHLPPNLPETIFKTTVKQKCGLDLNQLDLADSTVSWYLFVQGKVHANSKESTLSRAYIHFKSTEALSSFYASFNGHVFVDKNGVGTQCVVEYALYQKTPMHFRKTRRDMRINTIETDPDYIAFVESLKENPDAEKDKKPPQEVQPETVQPTPTTTPLLEHLRAVKAAKDARAKPASRPQSSHAQARQRTQAQPQAQSQKDAAAPSVPRAPSKKSSAKPKSKGKGKQSETAANSSSNDSQLTKKQRKALAKIERLKNEAANAPSRIVIQTAKPFTDEQVQEMKRDAEDRIKKLGMSIKEKTGSGSSSASGPSTMNAPSTVNAPSVTMHAAPEIAKPATDTKPIVLSAQSAGTSPSGPSSEVNITSAPTEEPKGDNKGKRQHRDRKPKSPQTQQSASEMSASQTESQQPQTEQKRQRKPRPKEKKEIQPMKILKKEDSTNALNATQNPTTSAPKKQEPTTTTTTTTQTTTSPAQQTRQTSSGIKFTIVTNTDTSPTSSSSVSPISTQSDPSPNTTRSASSQGKSDSKNRHKRNGNRNRGDTDSRSKEKQRPGSGGGSGSGNMVKGSSVSDVASK